MTQPTAIIVNTADLLRKSQEAMARAITNKDPELMAAAESVMSALIVVLRHRTAQLPVAIRPFMEKL